MRLKSIDGPLAVHNGNNGILNSPKRINTLQNSNITTTNYSNTTTNYTTSTNTTNNSINGIDNVITEFQNTEDLNILNNVVQDKVQWCQASLQEAHHNAKNNTHRRLHLVNVNINNTNTNTLAATLRNRQRQGVPPTPPTHLKNTPAKSASNNSICSQRSSPDDTSFIEYEDAQQSCSSADVSPQDEDRCFDISDSESSEDGNLSNRGTVQRRGIVNPNYPGFQHLAHTLTSDAEYTDDDLDCVSPVHGEIIRDSLTAKLEAEANNNNNVEESDTDYKIDSVNRLDSVENIQKVFYDKPVYNIEDDSEFNQNSECSSANSNNSGDEDAEVKVNLNIRLDERAIPIEDIVGDFRQEVEEELGRVSLHSEAIFDSSSLPRIEKATIQELEEAAEKLQVLKDLSPTAIKYNIEPNIEQPFNKLSPSKSLPLHQILEDSEIIRKNLVDSTFTISSDLKEDNFSTELKLCNTEIVTQTSLQEVDQLTQTSNTAISPASLESAISSEEKKMEDSLQVKIVDAFLSSAKENICGPNLPKLLVDANLNFGESKMEIDTCLKKKDSNRELEELECQIKKIKSDTHLPEEEIEKFCKEDITNGYKEKEDDSTVPRKKEKVETHAKKRRDYNQQTGSLITFPRREGGARSRETLNRRSVPIVREKKKANHESLGSFDVYNIETAMPKIDLEAIECHLRAAREEERRRRTDREEIRRRLAMGSEDDYYSDRPGRKPSLQARLQSGMNLQICFMNESLSDTDSPSSDSECPMTNPKHHKSNNNSLKSPTKAEKTQQPPARPATLSLSQQPQQLVREPLQELDFFSRQARLQTEARMALAQAKEMARMQMEIEKQRQKKSPITEMIRTSMEKVGIPFPEDKRRLSRQILTDMNVAQLQVIVNDLHTQIENLNDSLVKFLMARDDLHMEQDSMLVDIEDLTRYLGAKEQVLKEQNLPPTKNNNTPPSPAPSSPLQALNSSVKPHLHRIASLVKK
ncbi:uncharacterized protein LOC114327075 [Diabrotica virgifera virgifera]|uniref:Schwannomin interacting protein 1 C-terminal domain-containing protein n=1 Tax=Diabrotica virgifera virgifera TaxID=50390 RepID=A0ABM5KJ27_DIAVI|nr:uncharacterized protein LOC114327075 [Diabrotica virgifera virgifera]XP_050510204.1 uncharacterized protein LOC114327075 [Diabrotica virgifera virgifera]